MHGGTRESFQEQGDCIALDCYATSLEQEDHS